MFEKKSVSLYQLIYQSFLRHTIAPAAIIFVLIISIFIINTYHSNTNEATLEDVAQKSFQEISSQTSKLVRERFEREKLKLDQLKDTLELILKQKKKFYGASSKWVDRGGFYIYNDKNYKRDLKASVYSTNLLRIKREDVAYLHILHSLIPLVSKIVDTKEKFISTLWINTGKKYALAYPPISPVDELSPDLDITQYPLYYDVDPVHNSTKGIIFTAQYTQPWAVDAGEFGSFSTPVYEAERFIGVIGLSIYVDIVADIIKDTELPFGAYIQLLDENNHLIISSDENRSYEDFLQHSFYQLYKNPDLKERSLAQIKENSALKSSSIIYHQDIDKTNFKLRIVAKKSDVFANTDMLYKQIVFISVVLVLIIALIYLFSIYAGIKNIRHLISDISKTLLKVVDFSTNIGQRDDISLQRSSVHELDILNTNLTSTHNRLLKLILKDTQSGLFNRYKLLQDLSQEEGKSLMLLEVDNYKNIINLYGFDVAKRVLDALIHRLHRCEDMRAYRLEESLFALLQDTKESEPFFKLYKEISSLSISYESIEITPHIYCGVALGSSLIKHSELALLEAKKSPGSSIVTCKESELAKERYEENVANSNRFNLALKENAIIPYFQPVLNVKTGKIEGFEALARVQESENILAPAHFLDAAIQMSKREEITKIMIQKVFGVAAKNRDIGFSINLPCRDFSTFDLVVFIKENQLACDIEPSKITFELLEIDAIQEDESIIESITLLKKAGYKIAVDNFGKEHSNLAHLLLINVDCIKIDSYYIKSINTDVNSASISHAFSKFSSFINAKSSAKFVESEAILKRIKDFNIDYAQGYFISKPIPADKISSFLEETVTITS